MELFIQENLSVYLECSKPVLSLRIVFNTQTGAKGNFCGHKENYSELFNTFLLCIIMSPWQAPLPNLLLIIPAASVCYPSCFCPPCPRTHQVFISVCDPIMEISFYFLCGHLHKK